MPGTQNPFDDWTGGTGGGNSTGGGGNNTNGVSDAYSDTIPETGTLQILLGEGQIEGLVDGLKSVYLDNTAIQNADGSFNFKGVAVALVAGTNTQSAPKGITSTESETAVGIQVVKATPVVRSVTTNPSAVRVRISIPAFKVIDATTGATSGYNVTVKIERQNPGWNGGAWEVVALEGSGYIAGGPFATKFTKAYRVDLPISGTWQIRVTRVSDDDADAYHLSQTWWDAITEIVDARMRYPNSAVLSLRVNAKQFRTIPQVNVLAKLKRILVPSNYDPATRTYYTTGFGTSGGTWDGTFGDRATSTLDKKVWSDNPAWVFYDAATATRYGAGSFLSGSGLDKWGLYSIAQWCDTLVPDGKGSTEPRMTANLFIQGPQNAIKALADMASVFWGVVYYASGLIVPVPDSDAAPVALFTNANVEEGRFNYEGTARQARHTACIASFLNPALGYGRDTAVYEDEAGIARFGYNPLDLQAIGATTQGQALRLAKWAILTELLATDAVSFTTGLEGSTVKPGDVIQVADQFRAGNTRAGGRVASATTTVITLDAPVTLGAGTYTLRCQTATGMESRTVTTGAGTTSTLTVGSAFSTAPAVGAGWLLQSGTTAALYRVFSVRKGEGIKFEVAALLHDPAKYAALGLNSGDVVDNSGATLGISAPAGLAMNSTTRILNDRQQVTLTASWTLDKAVTYVAEASRDYGPWEPMAVSGASASLDGVQPGSNWRVRVCGKWRGKGYSAYSEVSGTVAATGTVPPWIATAQADATAAAGAAAYADALARSSHNLIKNGNSEQLTPTPSGMEAAGVTTDNFYTGTRSVMIKPNAGWAILDKGTAPCVPGDQFRFESQVYNATTNKCVLILEWFNAAGSAIAETGTAEYTGTGAWNYMTLDGTAPANAAKVAFRCQAYSTSPGTSPTYFDNLYGCRKVTAGMLEADLAVVGVIRSPGYTAGTSSVAPVGFKQSGPAFTTTYLGGATDTNCHFEMEGTGNFGGYKVATVNNRVFGTSTTWSTPGTYSWVCPEGVTEVEVMLIGGGGGGAGSVTNTNGGGGGGAGATIKRWVTVTPGTSYTIVVGAAGTSGGAGANGGDGAQTSFGGSLAVAAGGIKGQAASAAGGNGAAAVNGSISITGGLGGATGTAGGSIGTANERFEVGWLIPGGGGGGGGTAASGAVGGDNDLYGGGSVSSGTGGGSGGGGGSSSIARGGNGGTTAPTAGTAGTLGSGGGGGGYKTIGSLNSAGSAGGPGYARVRW